MDSLPSVLTTILQTFQPLMRSEVFSSFSYLLTGLLIGEAKAGTVRASVFAPAVYWPQRLSDLFCRHKLSGQALMAHLADVALAALYPHGLPERLFWIADATYTEKPYAQHIASVDWFHRLKHVAGVTDADGDPVTITPTSIMQDESVVGKGSGNTSPDATLTPLQVRVERDEQGNGRVYHIAFTATDGKGSVCSGAVTICVPPDQGHEASCVDGGPLFKSY